MNYFKYLDLNWKPAADKLLQYTIDNPTLTSMSGWKTLNKEEVLAKIPEIQEMFDPIGINVRYIALVVSDYAIGHIHIDADHQYTKCRVNFPVLNCEKTETRFYVNNGPLIQAYQVDGVPFMRINEADCVFVDQFYLERGAVAFRNNEPHQIVSTNPIQPRISCTVGFHEDITYLLEN